MNRITELFQRKDRNLLSVYFTAGYPVLEDTVEIIQMLENRGVDLVEIGIPFSDPMADGVVIQQSSTQALKNGMTLPVLLGQLTSIRSRVELPLLLMGYLNPMMQFGIGRLFGIFESDVAVRYGKPFSKRDGNRDRWNDYSGFAVSGIPGVG